MWFGCLGARSKAGGFGWWKIFARACHLGSLGMIAWVVVLHWLRVCDYPCWYSVSYQQTFYIFFVRMRFSNCFVYNCLCALSGTKKMFIVISGFACAYKCIFLVIIFNFLSFFREKQERECSALFSLAEKVIC